MRVVVMLLLGGCGSFYKAQNDADTGFADGGALADDTGLPEDDDAESGRWWTLDADLMVEASAVSAAASVVRLSLQEDAATTCVDTLIPTAITPVEPLPHDSVIVWLQVEWDAGAITCFDDGAPVAGSLLLGVGDMHPEIRALIGRMEDAVSSDAGDSLNGAYASLDGDDRLLVFGAAGPEASWLAEGQPSTDAPLSDGLWLVRPAYSFNLPD